MPITSSSLHNRQTELKDIVQQFLSILPTNQVDSMLLFILELKNQWPYWTDPT